jgi:hypothetical protein
VARILDIGRVGCTISRHCEMDVMEAARVLGTAISEGKANNQIIYGAHWEKDGTYSTFTGSIDFRYIFEQYLSCLHPQLDTHQYCM